MRYFPVNLDVKGRPCLIVGAGTVAARKAVTLLKCGADVTVISPEADPELRQMSKEGRLVWIQRGYESSDMQDAFMAFCAVNDREVSRRAAEDARKYGVLCNIADRPDVSDFTLPAVISKGDFMLSISTGGKSPALSRQLRRLLEEQFGDEYADALKLLGNIREKLLAVSHAPEIHRRQFRQLVEAGIVEMIRDEKYEEIDHLLKQIFGDGYFFESLMH